MCDYQSNIYFYFWYFRVSSISGKASLDKSDLEPALKALKDRLMTKNVVCFHIIFILSSLVRNYGCKLTRYILVGF